MNIREIKIENIRGIESKTIKADIHPNLPIFFVAPNGFGKTSIATAFKSIKRTGLVISEEDKFNNDTYRESLIKIIDDQNITYFANSSSNTISNTFSTFVISNQVKPKVSSRSFGEFSAATPSLIVEPIIICNSIPNTARFKYSFRQYKSYYGCSFGKLIYNLSDLLTKSTFVFSISEAKESFLKLIQKRNSEEISAFIELINSFSGTKKDLLSHDIDTSKIKRNKTIQNLLSCFSNIFPGSSELEKIINLIQIGKVVEKNKSELSSIFKWYKYLAEKDSIDEILGYFNCTWKKIHTSKQGKKLVVNFPKANQISNGERDVLCFIAKLFEAKTKLKKKYSILIIDEIFDYLDDANLIAVQYFLNKFIEYYKNKGKEFYPIILTHLDPIYFRTYSFSTKNVVYLYECNTTNTYKINELLKDRKNCKITNKITYDNISSHYLHYSPMPCNESDYIKTLRVDNHLLMPESFYAVALEELQKYIDNKDYDIALTCCGLRIYIEKVIYEKLTENQQNEYLSNHTTLDKLYYAKEQDVNVPEVYFLLSIIYNEGMHLDPQCNKLKAIACKLNNKVIHNMISKI